MGELYDLYKREFYSDLFALTNIGKRISGNNEIMINFIGKVDSVYTDCKFIYIPIRYKKDIKSSQGLVAHESGHIGYGSFEMCFIKLVNMLAKKYKLNPIFIKNLVNVVEDVRVNGINEKKFPGFYRNLRDLTTSMIPQLKSRINNQDDILLYINLFMEDYKDFQVMPMTSKVIMNKTDWEGIAKVKSFLLKSLTPSASIISCDILCNILEKYFDYRKNEQEGSNNTGYRRNLNQMRSLTFRQIENTSKQKRENQKSDIDKISEELIEKIKDNKLNPDDLDKLQGNTDKLKKKGKKNGEFKKKEKNNENPESTRKKKIKLNEQEKENLKKIFSGSPEGRKRRTSSLQENKSRNNSVEFKNVYDILKNQELDFIEWKEKGNKIDSDKKKILKQLAKILEKTDEVMRERFTVLEKGRYIISSDFNGRKRVAIETKIEKESMLPERISYAQIKSKYNGIITKMKHIFTDLKNKPRFDSFQKKGRLNNKYIKAVTSDYKFKKCFTRKVFRKDLKLLVMVDISGSMRGIKTRAAKIAMIMLYEALEGLAKLRIVLFTGRFNALNILLKDFDEKLNPRKIDKFGTHASQGQNVDGVSIKHEAAKLEKKDIIIVISDGQPAADNGYGLHDAIPEIYEVRKRFRVFAFSIDSKGEYLNRLYGKDWILAHSRNDTELGQKMIKFCILIVKEFFR